MKRTIRSRSGQCGLAGSSFISSKWESGRGYPSIDSLKEISRFFSVTIDELICPQEIISVAEDDKKAFIGRYISLICGTLDILTAVLLFIPAFGNAADSPATVSLFGLTGIQPWLKIVFIAVIGMIILNGICGVIISRFDQPVWNKHRLITGMVLSVIGVAVFIGTRQPYAGIICFSILAIKACLMFKGKT